MTEWIIHLKNGKSLTDKDAYPSDIDSNTISSVERIVDGRTYTICNHPSFSNFFVKTTAARLISLVGKGVRPPEILERILGCHILTEKGPIRLELVINPQTNSCKLTAVKVAKITKDGF